MSKFKVLDGPRSLALTPELANQYAEMEACPGDRPFSRTRYERLSTEYDSGRFRSPEWAVAYCVETQQTYRANGKHSSRLLATKSREELTGLRAVVTKYECKTLAEVAELYGTFDAAISSRHQNDLNRTVAKSDPDLADISASVLGAVVSGVAFGLQVLDGKAMKQQLPAVERAGLLTKYKDFVLRAVGHIDGARKELGRGPVIACMFAADHAGVEQTRFWDDVRTGNDPDPEAPTRKLQMYLATTSIAGGNSRGRVSTSSEIYAKCVHAMNAWTAGKTTALRYVPDAPLPLPVKRRASANVA